MNVLSRFLYLFMSLPIVVPNSYFVTWDKLISRFIWGGKKPRIKYKTLQLDKEHGGLALPNLKQYYYAAQLKYIACWCAPEIKAQWKQIEMNLGACRTDPAFARWRDKGLTALCLFLERDEIKSFEKLKSEFNLENRDLFRYLQLRHFYNSNVKQGITLKGKGLITIFTESYRHLPNKTISRLYKGLQSQNDNSVSAKSKWEKELNIKLSESDWHDLCKTQQTSTRSGRWKEFGWKIILRFFITPQIATKQQGKPKYCWRQCGHVNANHSHIFWLCDKLRIFWDSVIKTIEGIMGYIIPKDPQIFLLGLLPKDSSSLHVRFVPTPHRPLTS
uniref:Uncharacterized protein n=1 Tax=Oryzias melastigma TaxID=30732 RepID=A0A3B3BI18_ORYME